MMQSTLNVIIGKHGVFSQTPFASQIGASLGGLEAALDALAFGSMDGISTCAA